MKYLKLFKTLTERLAFIFTADNTPNVNYCEEDITIIYKEQIQPNNIITYSASSKLPETTSEKSGGLHTNAFNTSIHSHEFSDGKGTITFNDDVTSIGSSAFNGCSGLTSVTIPNSVTSIGSRAFNGCSGLTSVTIPNSVTSIGGWAFNGCSGLTSVTIPNSVTNIGDGVFYGCTSLTSVNIPNSVTSIGETVFQDCTSLTSITIPNSVTSIGANAFYSCSGLTSVNYDGTTTQWAAISKGSNWKSDVPSNCMVHCTDGDIAI